MNAKPLLIAAGLLAVVVGCTTTPGYVSRAPINANTPFAITLLNLSRLDIPPQATEGNAPLGSKPMVKQAGDRYAIVQCMVDAGGIVRNVQCVESSDAGSAQAAVTVISRGHFVSAKDKSGKPMAVQAEYGIVFHPEESAGNRVPETAPTHYYEEGINPKPPTYTAQGGGDGRSFWH